MDHPYPRRPALAAPGIGALRKPARDLRSKRHLSALAEALDPAALTRREGAYGTEGPQIGSLPSMCGIEECEVLHLSGRGIKRCEHLVATGNGDASGMRERTPVKLAMHEDDDDGLVGVNRVTR